MARILTLTLNPALDLTVRLPQLALGEVNRSESVLSQAAGKGLNVAQVLADLGHSLTVAGFLGADNAQPFDALFRHRGFADAFVRVPGETRSNLKLAEGSGRITDINGPGPEVGEAQQDALLDRLDRIATDVEIAVVAGSLPRGVDPQWLRELLLRLQGHGLKVAFDCSGAALRAGIEAAPWLIKPNDQELGEACGQLAGSAGDWPCRSDHCGIVASSRWCCPRAPRGCAGSARRVSGRRCRRRWKWPARWAPATRCWPAWSTACWPVGRPSVCCARPRPWRRWR